MSDNPEIDSSENESPLPSPSKQKTGGNSRFEQMRKNIKFEPQVVKPVLTHSESITITRTSRIDAIRSNLKNSFFTNARQQQYGTLGESSGENGDSNSNKIDSPPSQHSLEGVRSPFEVGDGKLPTKTRSISTQGDENDTNREESKSNTMDAIHEEDERFAEGFKDDEDEGSEPLYDPNEQDHDEKKPIFFMHIENEIEELKNDLDVRDDPNVHFIEGDFMNYYIEGQILGEGTTATVKKCKRKGTEDCFAVKIVHYRDDTENLINSKIVQEFKNHRKLEHKNIIRVYEIYIDYFTKKIYTILELADCPEMFEVLQDLGHYSEAVACHIFKQILAAINYMHCNGVCHRDLKPNNILVSKDGKIVKITDFNVSKFIERKNERYNSLSGENFKMWTYTGTIAFTAPEVFSSINYTESVDMWSAGVVLYTMLCGYQPFNSEYVQELIEEIKTGKYEFHPEPWDGISSYAKDLIRHCLDINPKTRYTSPQALLHEWITNAGKVPDSNITSFQDNLRKNGNRLVLATRDSDTAIPIPRMKTGMNLTYKSPSLEKRVLKTGLSEEFENNSTKLPIRLGTVGFLPSMDERPSLQTQKTANSIVLEECDEPLLDKKMIDSLEYLRSLTTIGFATEKSDNKEEKENKDTSSSLENLEKETKNTTEALEIEKPPENNGVSLKLKLPEE